MLAFRLTKRKDNVNCASHSQYFSLSIYVYTYMCVCVCVCMPSSSGSIIAGKPNGKSNIFAYEMSEKSKHGDSQARAASKNQA